MTNEIIKIKQRIYDELGLDVTIGIGPNLFLAKVALDNEAKKNTNQIAYWTHEDVETKLHKITPLTKIWSIGRQTEKKLNIMILFHLMIMNIKTLSEMVSKGDKFPMVSGYLYDNKDANGFFEMVEKNTINSKHTICFTILLGNPKTVLFCHRIGAVGMKGRGLSLRNFLNFSVKFRC